MMFDPHTLVPQTVQLRHDLPDGSSHIDWMLDLDPVQEARLVTFRVDQTVDDLEVGSRMLVERIADHRRDYLTYEGPVSGDRGHVERIATGMIVAMQSVGDTWAFVIRWQRRDDSIPRSQRLCVTKMASGAWAVRVIGN